MNKEAMKKEAIERLKMLELHPNVLADFVNGNKLNYSETQKMGQSNVPVLYWLTDEQKLLVEEFEEEHGCLVYHVLVGKYNLGGDIAEMISFLYVSQYEDEWELEREDLKSGYPIAYVINTSWDIKEFGSIGIKPLVGGILRVA